MIMNHSDQCSGINQTQNGRIIIRLPTLPRLPLRGEATRDASVSAWLQISTLNVSS